MAWYKKIPKIELHIHLEGAIPHQALFELIQKYGGDRSIPNVLALKKRFEYKNFQIFIPWFHGPEAKIFQIFLNKIFTISSHLPDNFRRL
jgi:hypothetical protein